MIKLSLIIPIYKVEKYIVECLESICCQLVEGVEVILVNDGTPDNSMLLAHQYISENYNHLKNQFVFVDQENQGQSSARNSALSKSSGEYVAFLDSDDMLNRVFFQKILEIIHLYEPDLIRFGADSFLKNKNHSSNFIESTENTGLYNNDREILKKVFNQGAWYPWLQVTKRKFFENNLFPLNVYFEDAAVIPNIFLESRGIYFLKESLYFYRINDQSSLRAISKENIDKIINSYNYILSLHRDKIQTEPLFGVSYISLNLLFVNFLFKNKNFFTALSDYNNQKNNIKRVKFSLLMKKSTKLYYYFGFVFIILLFLLNFGKKYRS